MLVVMMNTNTIIEGIGLIPRSAYPSSYSYHEDTTFNIVHSILPRCIIVLYIHFVRGKRMPKNRPSI
jgi:hypothetical protein